MSPSIHPFNTFADISVFERKWEVKGGTDQAHGKKQRYKSKQWESHSQCEAQNLDIPLQQTGGITHIPPTLHFCDI